jgi:hypothetical protein
LSPFFEWSVKLDRLIHKGKYLFCLKWSRLAENLIFGPVFEWLPSCLSHLKTGHKFVGKSNSSGIPMSGFQMFTVVDQPS